MLTLVNRWQRVPAQHPLRLNQELTEVSLKELSPLFEQMSSEVGRPSSPPERLLKASLLMALYSKMVRLAENSGVRRAMLSRIIASQLRGNPSAWRS
jgi:hypothetical protein